MPTDEQLDEFAKKAFGQPFNALSADNRLKVISVALEAQQANNLSWLAQTAEAWFNRLF